MRILFELIMTFMKIGMFTFGGGYAMIAVIDDICVERKKWITEDDMRKVTVIAESTPGPVAINCATFVGYQQAGFLGAIVATLGVIIPSFCVIYLISMFLDHFLEIIIIAKAFRGIKIAVGVLIFQVGWNMWKKISAGKLQKVILLASFVSMLMINIFSWNFSTITMILIAATVGLAAFAVSGKAKGEEK